MEEANRRITEWQQNGNVNAILNLSNLGLTELPILPANLKNLNCDENQLTVYQLYQIV